MIEYYSMMIYASRKVIFNTNPITHHFTMLCEVQSEQKEI